MPNSRGRRRGHLHEVQRGAAMKILLELHLQIHKTNSIFSIIQIKFPKFPILNSFLQTLCLLTKSVSLCARVNSSGESRKNQLAAFEKELPRPQDVLLLPSSSR